MKVRTANPRRGILLLIILALLAMFAMIAVAFVVLTGHERRTADAAHSVGQVTDPPKETLDQAFLAVARGSNNPCSMVKSWSLLEKEYGNELFSETITGNITPRCGGQLLEWDIPQGERRVGCVLTMVTGRAAGLSTRIVGLNPTSFAAQMMAFEGVVVPQAGDRYIVNGFPYGGMGFGYNLTTGIIDDKLALLPNHPTNWDPPGGCNTDYTAPDHQDPLVAYQGYDATKGVMRTLLPSLHRPELVQYWLNQPSPPPEGQYMFRPNVDDHPNFTGSNLNFNPLWDGLPVANGTQWAWDVDNDGDGLADSVWVDLGLPVRWTADGRAYKPLFAVLCLDMDGRLNINAHGMLAQTEPAYSGNIAVTGAKNENPDPYAGQRLAGGAASIPAGYPRGLGYGPAEINLSALGLTNAQYRSLLVGDPARGIMGRYAELGANSLPGGPGVKLSGLTYNRWLDYFGNYWTNFTTPIDVYGSPPDPQGFCAVALDLAGRPIYLGEFTVNGQTVTSMGGSIANTPYDINLARNAPHSVSSVTSGAADSPFGVADWERLLRPFDRDATRLPIGLISLTTAPATPTDLTTSALFLTRYAVTGESWHVPVAAGAPPKPVRDLYVSNFKAQKGDEVPHRVIDMLRALGIPASKWSQLLPAELIAGLKMDLNRMLSNWHPAVVGQPQQIPIANSPTGLPNTDFNYDAAAWNDATRGPMNAVQTRQWQARYLYVLMLMLREGTAPLRPGTEAQNEAAIRRSIAQWAINAVCFSTPDPVMVPFKYDPDPLTPAGWHCQDTEIGTKTKDPPGAFPVVWGCKPPELLLTETLAFHDRRVADTRFAGQNDRKRATLIKDKQGNLTPADADLDQPRVPQGSAFFELYCPRAPNNSAAPTDLYTFDKPNGRWELNLLKTAADDPNGKPVWRMVISESTKKSADNDVVARLALKPDSLSLEPQQTIGDARKGIFSLTGDPNEAAVNIERIIWFTRATPAALASEPNPKRIYYNRNPLASTLMLPAGQYLVVGPRKQTIVGSIGPAPAYGKVAQQEIDIPVTPAANPNPPDVILTDGTTPSVIKSMIGTNIQRPWGMVVQADPPTGFTNPIGISVSEPYVDQFYYDPPADGFDWYGAKNGSDDGFLPSPQETNFGDAAAKERPLAKENLLATQTVLRYKTVFLQRLANPSLPYDQVENPYLTVDWMPIDLTVFNGEDAQRPDATWDDAKYGLFDQDDPTNGKGKTRFASRQRGGNVAKTDFNIWAPRSDDPKPSIGGNQPAAFFNHDLQSTLGYLNESFLPTLTNAAARHMGDPATQPFPWLTWNARPYVSELELLLVPASHPARLCWEFYFTQNGGPSPYTPPTYNPNVPNSPAYFPHLVDFFQCLGPGAPQAYRLLDYVGVPSRFVGTETWVNPNNARNPNPAQPDATHWFHPPFNGVSNYREPGRINLNTIACAEVYNGLMSGFPSDWKTFMASRRGLPDKADDSVLPPASVPTRFTRPFRTTGGATLVPSALQATSEIEFTLLRPDPNTPGKPLFVPPPSTNPYNDGNRNAFFRYQGLQRLGNLVSTHSNVFAVWITVGYFEVTPWPNVDAGHPDGYQLGQELGSDTGEIERHRGFYIFDRSIPVGFIRGQDVNLDKAVLIRRFIE